MDNKIIAYLDENSTQSQPKTAPIIAQAIKENEEDVFNRLIFLHQKGRVSIFAMGGTKESTRFYR